MVAHFRLVKLFNLENSIIKTSNLDSSFEHFHNQWIKFLKFLDTIAIYDLGNFIIELGLQQLFRKAVFFLFVYFLSGCNFENFSYFSLVKLFLGNRVWKSTFALLYYIIWEISCLRMGNFNGCFDHLLLYLYT